MYTVPLRATVAAHLSQTLFSSSATCVPQPVFQGHCTPFISLCRCGVDSKNGDAIGGGGDESDEALA